MSNPLTYDQAKELLNEQKEHYTNLIESLRTELSNLKAKPTTKSRGGAAPKERASPINIRWREYCQGKLYNNCDGLLFFAHMTVGPDDEWDKPSLWPSQFPLLGPRLHALETQAGIIVNDLTKEQRIKKQTHLIWTEIIKKDTDMMKFVKNMIEAKTSSNNEGGSAPKKAAPKKAAPKKAVPKKAAAAAEQPKEEKAEKGQSDSDVSSSDEDTDK